MAAHSLLRASEDQSLQTRGRGLVAWLEAQARSPRHHRRLVGEPGCEPRASASRAKRGSTTCAFPALAGAPGLAEVVAADYLGGECGVLGY